MPHFEHEGWKLFYEDRGQGPPLLLLHGLLMDHTIFEPQIEVLAETHRVIAPDLRGHGRSEHRAEERSLWDLAEDQIALLGALGVEHAVWVGASVGGPIALRAALRHPHRISGLVLIGTQAGAEHPTRLAMYETFGEQVGTTGWTEDALRGTAFINFGPNAPTELTDHWIGHWRAQPVDDILEIMHSLTRRESLLEQLGEVRVPAWVAYGEEDGAALQRHEVEQMVATLPNVVEFVTIPRAGHTPTLQQPDAITALISRAASGTR